jgi:arylsulfatase
MIQEHHGLEVWERNFTPLRLPMLFNLRADPFERATESMNYNRWRVERAFALVPAQAYVGKFLESFKDFPPRQRPGSFSLGDAMERLRRGSAN